MLRDRNLHYFTKTTQKLHEKLTSKIKFLSLNVEKTQLNDSLIQNEIDIEYIDYLDRLFKDFNVNRDDFNSCIECISVFKNFLSSDIIKNLKIDIYNQCKHNIFDKNDETIFNLAIMSSTTQSYKLFNDTISDFYSSLPKYIVFKLEDLRNKNFSSILFINLNISNSNEFNTLENLIFRMIRQSDYVNDLIELVACYSILSIEYNKDDNIKKSNSKIIYLYNCLLKKIDYFENYSISKLASGRGFHVFYRQNIDKGNVLLKKTLQTTLSIHNIELLYNYINFNSIHDKQVLNLLAIKSIESLKNEFYFLPKQLVPLFILDEKYKYFVKIYLDKYIDNLSMIRFFEFVDKLFEYKKFNQNFRNQLKQIFMPIIYKYVFGDLSVLSTYFTDLNSLPVISSLPISRKSYLGIFNNHLGLSIENNLK